MAIVLLVHVVRRFVFRSPLIWSDEVVTMLQGTIAFAGIGYCFHKNQHIELSVVYDRVPPVVQIIFDLISNGVMLFVSFYMIKYTWDYTVFKYVPMNTIPWMKQSYIYVFITLGFVNACFYIIIRLVNAVKRTGAIRKKEVD